MNTWKYCVLVFLSIMLLTSCTDSESDKTDNEEKEDDVIYVCTFNQDLTGIDVAVKNSYLEKGYCCGSVVEYDKCGSGYAMRFTKE